MELATLRTRRPKRDAKLDDLFKSWQAEAKALGFELSRDRQQARQPAALFSDRSRLASGAGRLNAPAFVRPASTPATTTASQQTAAQLGHLLGQALRGLDQPSGMAGLKLKLRDRDREYTQER